MLYSGCEWFARHVKHFIPWVNLLGTVYLATIILGGVALYVFWSACMTRQRDSDSPPPNIDDAKYLAQLKLVLPFSFRVPRAPSKVLDHLYLASGDDASNVRKLKEIGVTHVINCASSYCITGPSFYGSGYKYLEFDAEDDLDYDIMQHFTQAYHFIEDARKSGGKALIHCIMGINRSGALAVAYLMVHQHIGPISAAEKVRKNRNSLLSNDGFQDQLIKLAKQRGLLQLDAHRVKAATM